MKKIYNYLRDLAKQGFFFLLPVYVLFVIITKAWTSLSTAGASIAGMFGMKSIFGVGGSTVVSGLLIIVSWIACGVLARFSFANVLNKAVERTLSKHIPGYENYKAMAEEKIGNKVKILPYTSALIKSGEYWQPAFIVEQDSTGDYIVFLPNAPETDKGTVLLAKNEQVKVLPSVTANQLAATLKKTGKGLLSEYGFRG